jgi:hypothetical protein
MGGGDNRAQDFISVGVIAKTNSDLPNISRQRTKIVSSKRETPALPARVRPLRRFCEE